MLVCAGQTMRDGMDGGAVYAVVYHSVRLLTSSLRPDCSSASMDARRCDLNEAFGRLEICARK